MHGPADRERALCPGWHTGRRYWISVAFIAAAVAAVAGGIFGGGHSVALANATAPDRAYELVSPPDKNGHDVIPAFSAVRSSNDGDAVTYVAYGSFPTEDAPGASWKSRYLARRGTAKWSNRTLDSKQDPQWINFVSLGSLYQHLQNPASFSPDLSAWTDQNYQVQLDPDHPVQPGSINLYRRTEAGTYQLLNDPLGPEPPSMFVGLPDFVAATPDRSHILFESPMVLTPDASNSFATKLYEWHDGTVRLIGIRPDSEGGGEFPEGTVGAPGPTSDYQQNNAQGARGNVLSQDGSRAYFLAGQGGAGRLYLRENSGTPQARTVFVSASEHTSPAPTPEPVTFWGATPDGGKALLATAEQLVDADEDSDLDLYRYEVEAPAGQRLTLISTDDGSGGELDPLAGVLGTADDQSRIYFATSGATDRIFVWQDGEVREVATLGAGGVDADNWGGSSSTPHAARVSADGRYLTFVTSEELTDRPTGGFKQRYLYDAELDGGTVTCVSCRTTGVPTAGVVPGWAGSMGTLSRYQPRLMTESGGTVRVFFDSEDAIVAGDVNGQRDAYVYDSAQDSTDLLSTGRSERESYFLDASLSGDDAFIATQERLTAWDRDLQYDVYDARVGGGLPDPVNPPTCKGAGCQGPQASSPQMPNLGTQSVGGNGNVSPGPAGAFVAVSRLRAVSGPVARLRVRVPGAGRIVVAGPSLRRAGKSVAKSGAYRLRVALRPKARRLLVKRKRVRVRARVTFRDRQGGRAAKTVRITFRQANARRATAGKGDR